MTDMQTKCSDRLLRSIPKRKYWRWKGTFSAEKSSFRIELFGLKAEFSGRKVDFSAENVTFQLKRYFTFSGYTPSLRIPILDHKRMRDPIKKNWKIKNIVYYSYHLRKVIDTDIELWHLHKFIKHIKHYYHSKHYTIKNLTAMQQHYHRSIAMKSSLS